MHKSVDREKIDLGRDFNSDKYEVNVKYSSSHVCMYEHMLDCCSVGGCFLVDGFCQGAECHYGSKWELIF